MRASLLALDPANRPLLLPESSSLKNRSITVYTQPGCQPCKATKRWLDKRGIEYATVDVTESPADLAAIKELGYQSVPVVIVSNGDAETDIHWQGLVVANLEKYTNQKAAA